jgi:hypothetical protein
VRRSYPMARSKELFTPDSIDEDIEFLMDESHSIFPDLNAQFLRELRSISKEDAASLQLVWERLEDYCRQQDALQEPSFQTPQRQEDDFHIIPLQNWKQSKRRNLARPLFTVLAAALIGLFVVSSLSWILAMRYPATPAAPRQALTTSMVSSEYLSHLSADQHVVNLYSVSHYFVMLTIHNDKSSVTNYFTLTYTGIDGQTQQHVSCQSIPPSNWVDVLSQSGTPVQIPTGQNARLQYFHSKNCNPSSMFLTVDLPIPAVPVYPHCWFNPDNTTSPNWSGCVKPSTRLSIDWS